MAIISKVFKPSDFESRDSLQGIFTNTDLVFNPLRANPTKWSNTLKQFVGISRHIIWVCLAICEVGA